MIMNSFYEKIFFSTNKSCTLFEALNCVHGDTIG